MTILKNIFKIMIFTVVIPYICTSCDYVQSFMKSSPEEDTGAYTGEMIRYYDNGKLKSKIKYVEGKRNGITKNYNREGKLISVLQYNNNLKNGECRNYYPNGKIHSKINYTNNIKNGLSVWFYENGKIYRKNPFEKGMLNGEQRKFHENGNLMSVQTYRMDWPCADLVEYSYSGKKKNNIPSIVIKEKNQVLMSGKYIINMWLSDKSQKVDFYFGKLDDGGCLNHVLYPIKTEKGIGTEVIEIARGSFFMEKINVVAVKTTKYKNKLILQKTLNLAVDNK